DSKIFSSHKSLRGPAQGLLLQHVEDLIQFLGRAEDAPACGRGGVYLAYHREGGLAFDEFRGAVGEQHGITAVFQMRGKLRLYVWDDIAAEQLVTFELTGFFVTTEIVSTLSVQAARVVKITGAHEAFDVIGGQQRLVKLR